MYSTGRETNNNKKKKTVLACISLNVGIIIFFFNQQDSTFTISSIINEQRLKDTLNTRSQDYQAMMNLGVFINNTEKSICVTSIYYHQNMRNLENTKISLFKFPNKKNKRSTNMRLHCVSRIEGRSKVLPKVKDSVLLY